MKKIGIRVREFPLVWNKYFRLMMLTLIFFMIGMLQVSASAYSQTTKLTFEMRGVKVAEILDAIEKQSEFRFAYSPGFIDLERQITVEVQDKTVDESLNVIFAGTDVKFRIYDRHIILYPTELETFPGKAAVRSQGMQQRSVRGIVTDSYNQTLPGVTIVVKGSLQGTVTNLDGEYSLSNIPENATLVFSFVGMRTQEVVIGSLSNIDVVMAIEAIGLAEVIAVGYGTQKKANLTGSVGYASSERLENRPIAAVGHGLQGVIPNLNIKYDHGSPTISPVYNIRGFESITGGSPLILIDGVPMDLERINPNDIASVTVLKDAAAAAVYGARAAFGVILVQTKTGTKGKAKVTFSTEQSLASPIFKIESVTDPYEFITIHNINSMNSTGFPAYDDEWVQGTKRWSENPTEENAWRVVNGTLRYYGSNDYQNKLIADFVPQQKHDMSISGASDNTSYYVSFGFLSKDGYLKNKEKNEKYNRYNILTKLDFEVTEWLSLDETIVFNSQVSDKPHYYNGDVNINSAARVNPLMPIQFPDLPYYLEPGDRQQYEQFIGMYFGGTNFFPYLEDGGRETWNTNDILFTQGATIDPFKGFKIRSDFSYRNFWRDYQDVASKVQVLRTQNLLEPNLVDDGYSGNDFINNIFNRSQYYVFNTYAEYQYDQLTNHYVKAMVGFNQEWGKNNNVRAQANTLITPTTADLNATIGSQQTWGGKNHVSLRGVFYRLNYIYKDKYLLETNGRYDGTSRFPKESRFGFFPSVSLGWRISQEPFMVTSQNWLDDLKIRASYGELGNQLLGNNYYPYISSMDSGMAPYLMSALGFIPYVSAAGLISPELTWETVATQNIGLDFTMLNYRLDVAVDAYYRDTKDMLMSISYPALLGASAPSSNAADLRTKGWELSITWRDRIGQDWSYRLNLGLSDNQTEITKFENPTGAFSNYYVGKIIGEIWGFETVGIFQYPEEIIAAADQSQIGSNWKPGDIQYADLDGDGKITRGNQTLDNPGDLKIIGNSSPRYSFGLNPEVSYKNWTVNVFLQGLFRDYMPQNTSWRSFYPFNSGGLEKHWMAESWSEENRDAYFPRPTATTDKKNYQPQTRYLQNAAYVRLKNLSVNYNLQHEWIRKAGMSKAQIYFSGMNLWEYTKMYKTLDPEQRNDLTQEYYFQRIFALGARITF